MDRPTRRDEAGSPNGVGAVALHAAITEVHRIGWDAIEAHDLALERRCVRDSGDPRCALARPHARRADAAPGHVHRRGVHHALVAARLSAEHAIGVRHGCFCAHQCLLRLLDLTPVEAYRDAVLHHDRRAMPGAVRASAGLSTSATDIDRLVAAVADIAAGRPAPVAYVQDVHTGDFWPEHGPPGWADEDRAMGASCARG